MVMMRIRQQASGKRHERWYQLGIPGVREASLQRAMPQRARRAMSRFAGLAFFLSLSAFFLSALLVSTLLVSPAAAQSTSSLNGSVSDASGAAVAGAKITLTEPATGLQRTTASNGSGLYQFLDVPPGSYQLAATATGFSPYAASKVTLLVRTPSTLNIQLQVEGVKTSVEVEGEAPLINRTDASLG